MVVFREVSVSSVCYCSVKMYSITDYCKKQAYVEFIVSSLSLLYFVLPEGGGFRSPRDWHISITGVLTWY